MTISMVLLGLLSYSVSSFTSFYVASKDKIISDRDAELALDYVIRDLESLIVPSRRKGDGQGIEVLRISPDQSESGSQWLTLLALTNDIADGHRVRRRLVNHVIVAPEILDLEVGAVVTSPPR